jgi:hypothetical protein
MIKTVATMASCRVCHRFLVKALGIATFFVVASLYKWIFGDGIVELKLNQRSLALPYEAMAQRSILESLEHPTEVVGSSITYDFLPLCYNLLQSLTIVYNFGLFLSFRVGLVDGPVGVSLVASSLV